MLVLTPHAGRQSVKSSSSSSHKPASAAETPFASDDTTASDWFLRILGAGIVVGVFIVLVHALQLITATVRMAERENLFGGLSGFAATMLIAAGGVMLATFCVRAGVSLWTSVASGILERRRIRAATQRAQCQIDRKQELLEERIRLAAQLRATWLFERECYSLANAQARREFRDALQTSVTRSCEMAFDQIGLVIAQYERTLQEIDASPLEAADKAELLEKLSDQLNVVATEKKNRSAERLMEDEIWKLRMETAQRLQQKSRPAALRYLQEVESSTSPCPGRRKLQAMIRRLESRSKVAESG